MNRTRIQEIGVLADSLGFYAIKKFGMVKIGSIADLKNGKDNGNWYSLKDGFMFLANKMPKIDMSKLKEDVNLKVNGGEVNNG